MVEDDYEYEHEHGYNYEHGHDDEYEHEHEYEYEYEYDSGATIHDPPFTIHFFLPLFSPTRYTTR